MLSDIETLDPARAPETGTVYSIAPLFHELLTYAYGSGRVELIPYAAAALPQISADRRTYTFKVRPGPLFAPHPAFGGKPRELIAEDFVYSWKRLADPAHSAMSFFALVGLIEGLDDAVDRVLAKAMRARTAPMIERAEMLSSLEAISIKLDFDWMPGGDRLKQMSNCQYQMTTMGFGGGPPDEAAAMGNFYSPGIGTVNLSCCRNDDYDRIYERLRVMPAGPERAPLPYYLLDVAASGR